MKQLQPFLQERKIMCYPQKTLLRSVHGYYLVKIMLIAHLFCAILFLAHKPVNAQCENAVTEIPVVFVEQGHLTTTKFRITNLEASVASVTLGFTLDGASGPYITGSEIAASDSMIFDFLDYINDIFPPIPADAENVSLVVSSNNCVTMSILPNARFTSSTLIGFAPLDVQFSTESLLVNEWDWDFGDGNTSTEESPVHRYTAAGNYTVTLTIAGDNGTALLPETSPIVITVLDEKSRVHLPFINTN